MTNPSPTTVYRHSTAASQTSTRQKLARLQQKNQRTLLDIHSVFPFKFFPTRLLIDEEKVVVIDQLFIAAKRISPLLIQDIRTVSVEKSFFLATIKFDLKQMEFNPHPATHFHYADAIKAQELVTSLIMYHHEGIDTTKLEAEEVLEHSQNLTQAIEA